MAKGFCVQDFADRPLSAPIVFKDGHRCVTQLARWDTRLFECRSRDKVECRTRVDLDYMYWYFFYVPCEVQGSVVLCLAQQEVFLIEGDGRTCYFLNRGIRCWIPQFSSFLLLRKYLIF